MCFVFIEFKKKLFMFFDTFVLTLFKNSTCKCMHNVIFYIQLYKQMNKRVRFGFDIIKEDRDKMYEIIKIN